MPTFSIEVIVDMRVGVRKAAQMSRALEWCSGERVGNYLLNQSNTYLRLTNGAMEEMNATVNVHKEIVFESLFS